jgi:saccharopine dehydrogenase (NAD+, L-lysine-forming)
MDYRRIISFGYYAGVAGCALGLKNYLGKLNGCLIPWYKMDDLYQDINKFYPDNLKIAITTGKNGKVGQGVKYILDSLKIKYDIFDRDSDKSSLINYDIFYNCINLKEEIEPWFTIDNIKSIKNKITIVDISCDYDNKLNPIQIYDKKTTWENPVLKLKNIDVIAIDNLPSLLPVDSSIYFSTQLRELLSNYHNDTDKYWIKNENIFYLKIDS